MANVRGGRNNVDRVVLAAFGAHRPTRRQVAEALVVWPKKIKFYGLLSVSCGRRRQTLFVLSL